MSVNYDNQNGHIKLYSESCYDHLFILAEYSNFIF